MSPTIIPNRSIRFFIFFIFTIFTTLSAISQTTIDIPVTVADADSGDDAEEDVSTGTMDLASSDLELYNDPDDADQLVGIRFQNVTIPYGATINSAYIQFMVDEEFTGSVTIDIVGIDVDDAVQFTATDYNISDRIDGDISSGTTATVSWSPPDWGAGTMGDQGADQQTSDISTIVKEIVDRGGWSSGNDMAFVFTGNSGSPNRRTVEDGNASGEGAILHIVYTGGCTTTISSFPYNEGFESDLGAWTQGDGDDFDWTRKIEEPGGDNDSTPSDDTGPELAGGGSYFLFIEASNPRLTGDIANLESPCFDLTGISSPQFSFSYHMFGAGMGTLNVDVSTDYGVTYTPTLWTRSGQQHTGHGDAWSTGTIDLSSYAGSIIKLRFSGIRGTDYSSDIAIDDVSFTGTVIPVPEINITGKGIDIIDGDTSTSSNNDTRFQSTAIATPITHTFTIQNTGVSSLNLTGTPDVAISGDAEFTITAQPASSTIAAAGSTTFTVQFNPTDFFTKTATISIESDDSDENPYTFALQGTIPNVDNFGPDGEWKYLDDGSDQATAWYGTGFDDSSWVSGDAELGYGDGDEVTIVSFGADPDFKHQTTYFRKTFTASATDVAFANMVLSAKRDDGMVVYLNGTEVWRDNMAAGAPAYNDFAADDVNNLPEGEDDWTTTTLANALVLGTNVIAVEIHQRTDDSSDISFNFDIEVENGPILSAGGAWYYLDDGSDLDTDSPSWKTDNTHLTDLWPSGASELGFGDGGETTLVTDNNQITTYFRKQVNVTGTDVTNSTLQISAIRDDGIVIYINGVEVLRNNMPVGSINYNTLAFDDVLYDADPLENFEDFWNVYEVPNTLISGNNQIAVEIHQYLSTSDDISFNLELETNNDFIIVPSIKPDRDSDSVEDYLDADDDNDGIPDIVEGCFTTLPESLETEGDGETQIIDDFPIVTSLLDGNTITYSVNDKNNFDDITAYDAGEHGYGIRLRAPATDGQITLEFTTSVSNLFFKLIDFDEGENMKIDVYDDSNVIVDLSTEEGIYHLGSYIEYTGTNTINEIYNTNAPNTNNPENRADDIYGGAYFYFPSISVSKVTFTLNSGGGTIRIVGVQYCSKDTDGDGIDDFYDSDSDNDGIPDIVEAGGVDTNGDGKVDNFADADGDGVTNIYDTNPSTYFIEETGTLTNLDFDGDGITNQIDLDSDNDGIPDILEAGGTDSNGDGKIDSFLDSDNDGYHDAFDGAGSLLITGVDSDSDGLPDSYANTADNPDSSGFPNFKDIDSDDDGITDHTEAQVTTATFIGYSGTDTDGDGILDVFDDFVGFAGKGLIPTDSDSDGTPDFLDSDSDDDGEDDILEGHDTNGDGVINTSDLGACLSSITANNGDILGIDTDSDGLDDGFDNDNVTYDPSNSGINPTNHPNIDDIATVERDWREPNQEYNFIDFDGVNDYIDFADSHDITSSFSIEAWVKQDATSSGNGMIISKRDCNKGTNLGYSFGLVSNQPNIKWYNNSGTLIFNLTSTYAIGKDRWYYISATYDSGSSTAKIYIDGVEVATDNTVSADPSPTNESFLIGAKFDDTDPSQKLSNKFHGWMDEIRVWNIALSPTQIREMLNQEIELSGANGVRGKIIPKDIAGLNWSDLLGYYPLNSISSGNLMDESANTVNGRIRNITTTEPQTAPLPYTTTRDGDWDDATATTPWTYGDSVWNIPNTTGIDSATEVDWNIVAVSDNVDADRDVKLLGLVSESTALVSDEEITDSELTIGKAGGSHELNITSYLKLDGKIDLENESQLIQGEGSWLDVNSKGYVERDQQGTQNSFTYNYWSSPVSLRNTASNNATFTIADVLRDGTNATTPASITFCDSPYCADNATVNTSRYWFWKFVNNQTNAYINWEWLGDSNNVNVTEGYTMKGTLNTAAVSDDQNYVFRGKPNNIINGATELVHTTFPASFDGNGNPRISLAGNPFPSALDAIAFIDDNIATGTNAITGTLYFWEHWSNNTHVLSNYQGGYATYTKMGGIPAASHPDINQSGVGTKTPGQYIPVGQGFFVYQQHDIDGSGNPTTAYGGDVVFKNSQRVFEVEQSNSESVFTRSFENTTPKTPETPDIEELENRQRIWLGFESPNGFHRQVLAGFINGATNEIDRGYDGSAIDVLKNDAYFVQEDRYFGIVAFGEFSIDREIPITVFVEDEVNGGAQKFMIDKLDNIPDYTEIYIKDNSTGETYDLREQTYEVSLGKGEYKDRFSLVFKSKQSVIEEAAEETEPEETETESTLYDGEMIVYMNNNTSTIDIRKSIDLEISRVTIFNYLGQTIQIWTNNLSGNDLILPLNRISTGTYILKIETNEEIVTKKVIIE